MSLVFLQVICYSSYLDAHTLSQQRKTSEEKKMKDRNRKRHYRQKKYEQENEVRDKTSTTQDNQHYQSTRKMHSREEQQHDCK
jgi:hypothetical protein